MCGIVGIWNLNGSVIDSTELYNFADSLSHRGPDDRGIYIDSKACVGLGHRRLAIFDLTDKGHQPMSYANGRYWITYNGEVYNFIEIREELEGMGYHFNSESDTEVVLASYIQWGEDCQLRFNGMWAFAIWDAKERVLFLSRDRFGVKPLHYFYNKDYFAFASEMKAFLHLKWFQPNFDPYIVARAIDDINSIEGTEDCLLQGMKRLKGGYCLTLRYGQEPRVRRWWNTLQHLEEVPEDYGKQVEHYRHLFFDACKIRMRSDVPLGTCLSGGLDSSSVHCTMAKIKSDDAYFSRGASDWQRVFTATFPGSDKDESEYAKKVVSHTGTVPVYKEIEPYEVIAHLEEMLFQLEEIYPIPSALWLIYRELRKNGVFISMDGHGGDEALSGYRSYLLLSMFNNFLTLPKRKLLHEEVKLALNNISSNKTPSFKNIIKHGISQGIEHWSMISSPARFISVVMKKCKRRFRIKPTPPYFADFKVDQPMLSNFDFMNRMLYYDFHFKTLPTILRNFDRCSMAHGVEIRAPLLDWRLVCYAFSLPTSSKIGEGFTKRILRDAMRGVLPESIRTRKQKMGFRNPTAELIMGPMKPFFLDSVNSQAFLKSEIWDGTMIRNLVEKAYTNGDHGGVRFAWEFVQAMHLMELFKKKKLEISTHLKF